MEKFCENLWKCLPTRDEEARNVIHRIAQYFQRELTSEERDFALHVLLQDEKGLASFLSQCLSNKVFQKISSDIFCLFSFLVEYHKTGLAYHVVKIKDVCTSWLKNPTSSDSKDKALDTLIAILCSGTWTSDLDVLSLLTLLMAKTPCKAKIETPSVLRKVYKLIGAVAELYPHEVHLHEKKILRLFLKELQHQTLTASKVEFLVIEGCLDGLAGHLQSFPLNPNKDHSVSEEILTIIKKVLLNQTSSRHTAHRAALKALSRHASQFASFLVSSYQEWHNILCSWLCGKEERTAAKSALLTFYKVVSSFISSANAQQDMLQFFIDHFKNQFASSQDTDIAIKGFGLFSKPCKLLLSEEMPVIFNLLAQRAEEVCEQANKHKLTDFLESLAAISAQLGLIHSAQLAMLEGLTVQLVSLYPHEENPNWQAAIINSIVVTIMLLNQCGGMTVDLYLNTTVYQGLLRTVSHPVIQEVALLKETGRKVVAHENYLPLWHGLVTLNITGVVSPLDSVGIAEKKELSTVVFDKIMYSFLEIIHRLDLSLVENADPETVYLNDIEKCLRAAHPQDFTVLVNIVDFIVDFLNDLVDASHIDKWISPLILATIKLSTKHPLVSSFYKMLANVVKVASQVGYFKQEDKLNLEWKTCVNLLSGFLHEVIVHHVQYKGDLQVACLHLILATPSNIAVTLFPLVTSACTSVFRIGASMLSLAQEGLQTLIRWNEEIPKDKMKPVLEAVLPMFDRLLQSKDAVTYNEDEDENEPDGMTTVKKVAVLQRKQKTSRKHAVQVHVDTELGQLQTEIIMFLSTLDSHVCAALLDGSTERSELMLWTKEKFLEFPLPFADMKVPIKFDDLLPRLCDIVLNCSDRQTRSSACELLHAVIMFMLGKEKQLEVAHQGQLTDLWKRLFPLVFNLACDADLMITQLYRPLGEQLAHWYSSEMQLNSPQASIFVEALLSGVTHDKDAALRDYSAFCLQEFVTWARKQGNVYKKVVALLKQVVSLCQHPSSHKRMGAALAFNSIYRILREDRKIVDEFWLELLHCFCTALALCSITGEETQTEKQIKISLNHVLRVLIECKNIFNLKSEHRRIPKDFTGSTLWHAVCWLLGQCTDTNSIYRINAMDLVSRLAPYVPGCCSLNDVLDKIRAEEGPESLSRIVEGTLGISCQLSNQNLSWDKAMKWVHSLLARMEICIWLMGKHVSPTNLLDFHRSSIFQDITDFLNKVIDSPVQESPLWRPKAIENFNTAKCTCIVRLIEFLSSFLETNLGERLTCLWTDEMWQIISYCTLWPSHIGFDTSSKIVIEKLPLAVEKFLQSFVSSSSLEVVDSLKECMKRHALQATPELLTKFSDCVREDKVEQKLRDLVGGLMTYQKIFKDAHEWSGLTADSIHRTVFSGIVRKVLAKDSKAPISLGPSTVSYAEMLLKLSFCLPYKIKTLIILTCDGTPLHRSALQGHMSHGEHFVISFKSVLTQRIIQYPTDCVEIILEQLSNSLSWQNLSILPALLGLDFRTRVNTRENLRKFVEVLLFNWNSFANWAQNDSQREAWLISILCHLVALKLPSMNYLNFDIVCSWILERLVNPDYSLTFKTSLISVLPILSTCGETSNNEVKSALLKLKQLHFPLYSSEFPKGSEKLNNLVRAFEELLKTTRISGSVVILEAVVKMMAVDEHHPCHHLLPSTLESFMHQLKENTAHQRATLFMVYNMFRIEGNKLDCRLRILNKFLLPLMKYASMKAQNEFAEGVIHTLVNVVRSKVDLRDNKDKEMRKMVTHIGCWNVLQHIFGFSSPSHLEEKGSELVKAGLEGSGEPLETGKELVRLLTKTGVECLGRGSAADGNWNCEFNEIRRLYFCAVYNMLATLLCNLKTSPLDIKFYEKFLFSETQKTYIWRNLVDNSKTYMQPYEHSRNLKSVKQLVTIRRQVREQMNDLNTSVAQSLDLLGSQSAAFAGTLEEDITRFDFTHSSVLAAPAQSDIEMPVDNVVLESDVLNNHECMAMLCGVVRHLVDSRISPVPETPEGSHPLLPQWMKALQTSMRDSSCPRNSCIFLLRLILNCEPYFYPYAYHWLSPALECVAKHCLGSRISYLLGDLVCMFVKWSAVAVPDESHRASVSAILSFLVKNCYSDQKEIFRFHLELVRSIVNVWRKVIDPPFLLLENFLAHSDKTVGTNLMAIMLFNDIPPWTNQNKQMFFRFLMKGLQESKKSLYKMSAETIGLCFKYLKDTNEELHADDKAFLGSVMDYAKHAHLKQSDADRFLTVLYALHDKVSSELDSVVPIILFYLVQTTGDMKAICLTLLERRLECLGVDAYKEIKDRDISSMLLDRNTNVQTRALQVLRKLAPSLPEMDLLEVLQMISMVPQQENKIAREIAYEIALASFDQFSFKKEEEMLTECEQDILKESKAILLWGLVDKNFELQRKLFSMWCKEERLPLSAPKRLFALLNGFYSPSTEDHFLGYGVELMMEATTNTPDYNSAVFQHGLEKCDYQPYQPVGSFHAKHATMIPMFAQTYASQISSLDSQSSSFSDASMLILATQNSLAFQQTPATYGDDPNSSFQSNDEKSFLKSSLIFTPASQFPGSQNSSSTAAFTYKQGPNFGSQRLRFSNSSSPVDGPESSPIAFRSRRFLGKGKSESHFSLVTIRRMNRREELRKERILKRDGQVSILRKYRKGDFPDIQIKTADFIFPLKELAKRDSSVARKVFVSLFMGVKEDLSNEEECNLMKEVASIIGKILESSKIYETSMVGALLEISYNHKFQLNPNVVSSASKKSGLLSLGVLLLESYLEVTENDNDKKSIWLSLAELYNALNERDVAHSILVNHIEVSQVAKEALLAHAEDDWLAAKRLYYQAVLSTEVDNFYDSLFECMIRLSEWKDVNQVVRDQVEGNLDKLWGESWFEEKLLPRLIHSEVLKITQQKQDENNFINDINRWLKDEEKAPILKDRFCEPLCILSVANKNFPKSRFYATKSLAKFIDDWSDLNPLSIKQRERALVAVQPIAEVLVFLKEMNSAQFSEDSTSFLKRMESVLPAAHDSLDSWETRISYRNAFMNQLPNSVREETKRTSIGMYLCLAESALQQNNRIFAKKYNEMVKREVDFDPMINNRWLISKCQELHLLAKSVEEPVQRLCDLLKVWSKLDLIVGNDDVDHNPQLSISAHSTESSLCSSVKLLLCKNPESWGDLRNAGPAQTDWLLNKLQLESPSTNELILALENVGLRSLIHSKNITKNQSENHLEVADAYLRIAQYCRNTLGATSVESNTEVLFSRTLVQAILSSMRYGSSTARQLFPLLLQLPNLGSELAIDFRNRIDKVPEWMFLRWIPQLLAVLDTNFAPVIMPLLLKIALKFPNAIIYPYNISRERYNVGTPNLTLMQYLQKLDSVLATNSVQDHFIRSLSCLCHPSVIMGHHLKALTSILFKSQIDWSLVTKICNTIYSDILQVDRESGAQTGDVGKLFHVFRTSDFQNALKDFCGAIRQKDKDTAVISLRKLNALNKIPKGRDSQLAKALKLKDLSPWLSEFSSSKLAMDIEIPGQYHGDRKPIPERHVLISCFIGNVQVMPSIRKPVKLTIVGSDALHYDFLVKFGEDLRQDERVQQLFTLMNGVFQNNPHCWNRRLSLVTYKVVPLSSCLGIIEWVDHTTSLKDLMLNALSDNERDIWLKTRDQHGLWFGSCASQNSSPHIKYDRAESLEQFLKLSSSLPLDVLRRGFSQRSSSAETLYSLRHTFITSYCTMSIAHWLLGVGDRHLSNCLMSVKSGHCVGIDFGHMFGTATQFLPIPELIPFRLTPHIVGLMTPFNKIGLIEETMVHCLRALRADSEVLLATMQVFILEPSLDWLQFSQKIIEDGNFSVDGAAWLPTTKINQAQRKLEGVNPVIIVLEDLKSGHHQKGNVFKAICNTLEGDISECVRSKLAEEGLSPRQQVESLIDLATDGEVLCKTFVGWEPWM